MLLIPAIYNVHTTAWITSSSTQRLTCYEKTDTVSFISRRLWHKYLLKYYMLFLMQILEYHVYAKDAYKVSDFTKHSTLVTAEGETLAVSNNSARQNLMLL